MLYEDSEKMNYSLENSLITVTSISLVIRIFSSMGINFLKDQEQVLV